MMNLPKRLIEVDLPIKKISEQARREKSIRHGHISTLHIWWARRPLAACRAVLCACLWPDPADPLCPPEFQKAAAGSMKAFRDSRGGAVRAWDDPLQLRRALLDFIADFSNWDNSTVPEYLKTARDLTQAAHEALGGAPGTRPLVVDPFAGGGSIPLEALRIGADAFASDLNPVAVLLNKVVLEYIPKYGQRLADEVRKWGTWIKEEAEKELAPFYPKDPDGAVPIAYLWARTIQCEGPGCGATIPLLRSTVLAKRTHESVFLLPDPSERRNAWRVTTSSGRASDQATVRKGSVTCPRCAFTVPVATTRRQLVKRGGGTTDSILIAVVTIEGPKGGRRYRLPSKEDLDAIALAGSYLSDALLAGLPTQGIPVDEPRRINVHQYGIRTWAGLFNARQALSLTTTSRLIRTLPPEALGDAREAVLVCLSLALGRLIDANSAQATWSSSGEFIRTTFGRQALPFVWDFAEACPWGTSGGNWDGAIDWVVKVINETSKAELKAGIAECASALQSVLPDDSADALVTDPPYYYSVPYSHLSDFFYVWHRLILRSVLPNLFRTDLTPKHEECVQSLPHSDVAHLQKSRGHYESSMLKALGEARRVAKPSAISTVVFAHTSTDAWEALLSALLNAGWLVTASWPIDTERGSRALAQRQRTLASSVHIVLRPRENPDGSVRQDVGDWGDVITELPRRIHEWMPRLAEEGVVGADAIFSCLGPALEVFSRYSRVERADGSAVTLREYLEHVWAAVSREALRMVLQDADTAGFEPDARLTAIWLWTLSDSSGSAPGESEQQELTAEEDEEGGAPSRKLSGFTLEFDAARKIAQGLGARLEELTGVVEVKGETARLLPISERVRFLLGKREEPKSAGKKSQKKTQLSLFQELEEAAEEQGWDKSGSPKPGLTVLDRLHQAMILFADNRTTALKRFLVEEGAGQDARLWKLAQALSALYPAHGEEKRWVDGVLARKKALGF